MLKDVKEEKQQLEGRDLLEARINDQYRFAISKNKITNTDFLNQAEKLIAEKFLKENRIQNFLFFRRKCRRFGTKYFDFFPRKII